MPRIIESKRRQIALLEEKKFGDIQATEERIIETIAALAFYDPREIISSTPPSHTKIQIFAKRGSAVILRDLTISSFPEETDGL